jgi:hypothetical protein
MEYDPSFILYLGWNLINGRFSIPDDLNLDIKRMAKDALERLSEFATFTIKDKVSGEKKNPFA